MRNRPVFNPDYSPCFVFPKEDKQTAYKASVDKLSEHIKNIWGDTLPLYEFIKTANTIQLGWNYEELKDIVDAAFEALKPTSMSAPSGGC